jgi:hypothetical protein
MDENNFSNIPRRGGSVDASDVATIMGGLGLGSSLLGIPLISYKLPTSMQKYKKLLHVLNGTRGVVGGGLLLSGLLTGGNDKPKFKSNA